jgi:C4-dicarboxylate-specific signal transduction histidine kinase
MNPLAPSQPAPLPGPPAGAPPALDPTAAELWTALARASRSHTYGTILRGILHEVRNPAQALLLASRGIADASGLSADHRLLTMLEQQSERLTRLLHGFGAALRDPKPAVGVLSVEELLRGTMILQAHQRAWPDVETVLEMDGGPLPAVRADAQELEHALLEVLTNAKEAVAATGGVVTVAARASAGVVVVEVRDGGPGIPAARRAWAFAPFATTKTPAEGRGLGLTVARLLAERAGGTLTAEEPLDGQGGGRLVLSLPGAVI